MLLANFNRKEHLRHRAVSLRQHGFLVWVVFNLRILCIFNLCIFLYFAVQPTKWHCIASARLCSFAIKNLLCHSLRFPNVSGYFCMMLLWSTYLQLCDKGSKKQAGWLDWSIHCPLSSDTIKSASLPDSVVEHKSVWVCVNCAVSYRSVMLFMFRSWFLEQEIC